MYLTLYRTPTDDSPAVVTVDGENWTAAKVAAVEMARQFNCVGGRLTSEPNRSGGPAVAPLAHLAWSFWLTETGADLAVITGAIARRPDGR